MSTLWDLTFEAAHLYDKYHVLDGSKGFGFLQASNGTLEISAAAAHDGSYGLEVTPASSSTHFNVGGFYAPNRTAMRKIRQRLWVDPNSISMTSGQNICIARSHHPSYNFVSYRIYLGYVLATGYRVQAVLYNGLLHDAAVGFTSYSNITDAWHRLEWYYQAGVSGSLQFWVDGASIDTVTGDLTDNAAPSPAIGVCYPGTSGIATSGLFYLDSWKANDDGSEIGA